VSDQPDVGDWIRYAWFACAAPSAAYVAWDDFVRKSSEEMKPMLALVSSTSCPPRR
jgi:hypothetical protein